MDIIEKDIVTTAAAQDSGQAIRERIIKTGVDIDSPAQARVLRSLLNGSITAKDAAKASATLGPSLSRILNTLEERKMLTRKTDKFGDKREITITITPKGRRQVKKVIGRA